MRVRAYRPEDEGAVIRLWEACDLVRPWNDPHRDIERKMKVRPDLFLVLEEGRSIIGTVMVGYEGHRGWINYLAILPALQGRGLGRRLMEAAEERLRKEGCPKVNLQVRSSNQAVIDFYRAIGYAIDDAVSLGKRLVSDEPEA